MKKILTIFTSDVKNITTNWVAAVLIGGLVFLPSLYAWLNIEASWDPYSQTEQLPVAIVNEDKGADIRGKEIDVGNELVKSLKENKEMNWNFTNRKKAMDKVEYGDYFAVIIIPEDFSEKLASVISNEPEKAAIEYYVNEKINSIAPKITQKGASVIVEEISGKFVSTVNGVIFDVFNDIGIEIETDLPDIKKFENYILETEKKLPELNKLLNESLTDATSVQGIIGKAQGILPEASQLANSGLEKIDETTNFLTEAESRLNDMAPKIKEDLEKVQRISSEANAFLEKAQSIELDFTELDRVKTDLDAKMIHAIETVGSIEKDLIQLKEINATQPETTEEDSESSEENTPPPLEGKEQLDHAIEETAKLKAYLQEAQKNVESVDELVEGKQQQLKSTIDELQEIAATTSVKVDSFIEEYKNTIEPKVLAEVGSAKGTLKKARDVLVGVQSTLPEMKRILDRTSENLIEGKETLEHVLGEFPYVNDKVNQLADKIREVQSDTDINEVIQLLKNDPQAERSFFEEPIVLNEHKLFPIENYGTGMTPFYTVLAIWVGCLLLISLLAVDSINDENYKKREVYFGRLLTFLTIGLFQSLIVTVGDIVLLGVKVHNPFWFILFGLLISFVFMTIVYTLVSVFGDVGKALAIVMLVLQIAGSGGTYPVALLPKFFQLINPFLPFTYAIDLMREAVGGIIWQRVQVDFIVLIIFGLGFMLFGAFLKNIVNRKMERILKKSKESGLFH